MSDFSFDQGQFDFGVEPSDDDEAKTRSGDPWTSYAAAESISSHKMNRSRDAVWRFLKKYGPCTDKFLEETYTAIQERHPALYPQQSLSGLRSRRNELVKMGKVFDTGRVDILDTGNPAKLWAAVLE